MKIVKVWRRGKRVREETREWVSEGYYPSENGRSCIYIRCPFCDSLVKAYVWSLAGSGKKCPCGAQFSSFGQAFRRLP